MKSALKKKRVSKGFIITFAVGILLLVIVLSPNYNPPHPPPYNKYMKSALRAFQVGCVIFWEENENLLCNKDVAFNLFLGDKSFPREWKEGLTIQGGGMPETFSATAFHEKSTQMFKINAQGDIEAVARVIP